MPATLTWEYKESCDWMPHYDALMIGAGFAGAVAARRLAEEGGKKVLILERRAHLGGNAYDCLDEAGVLVHRYGPHIFHTNDKRVYDYLSRFTRWYPYQHKVAANIPTEHGRTLLPVPFNLVSLEVAFGAEKARELEEKLVSAYGAEKKVTILELRQNPDPEISALADYVYEHVFVTYTMKQWGQTPEEIDPATTARVPVFLSRDCRYFQDAYQGMPQNGYTALFQRMLEHPGIEIRLNADARDFLNLSGERVLFEGAPFDGPVVYTGAVDELFSCRYGRLPYRTLDFRFETYEKQFFQTHGTVNYTMDQSYTRITEFKYLTGQRLGDNVTTIMKEYSRAYTGGEGEIPYYAVINPANTALYEKYRAEAGRFANLFLLGRLAEYKYYNMDAIAARALALAGELLK